MSRDELKEIIVRVIDRMGGDEACEAPVAGCIYKDAPEPCDATSYYAIGEES